MSIEASVDNSIEKLVEKIMAEYRGCEICNKESCESPNMEYCRKEITRLLKESMQRDVKIGMILQSQEEKTGDVKE